MGVSLIMPYPTSENKSSQQVLENLYKLMDTLNARRSGVFKIDCETYNSSTFQYRVLHTLHDTDQQGTTFAIIENGQILVATSNFDVILTTYLTQHFPCKKGQRIECCGQKFELSEGDFIVRIGSVSQDIVRGIVIEIEFTPSLVPQDCWDILTQVANNFLPHSQIPHMPIVEGIYKPSDKMRIFQQLFNNMRKK